MTADIGDVLAKHTPRLMGIPGVVGTGQGVHDGRECIVVFVRRVNAVSRRGIPNELEGHPVRIQVVGEIGPLF